MRHRKKKFKLNNNLKNKIFSFFLKKNIIVNIRDCKNITHYFYKIKNCVKNNKYSFFFINFKKVNLNFNVKSNFFIKKITLGFRKGDNSKIYKLKIVKL
ncbi:hypothetical protein [Candidatus Vidania fulgoroideorum]